MSDLLFPVSLLRDSAAGALGTSFFLLLQAHMCEHPQRAKKRHCGFRALGLAVAPYLHFYAGFPYTFA